MEAVRTAQVLALVRGSKLWGAGPCILAQDWLEVQSPKATAEELYAGCPNGTWLAWLIEATLYLTPENQREVLALTCRFAERARQRAVEAARTAGFSGPAVQALSAEPAPTFMLDLERLALLAENANSEMNFAPTVEGMVLAMLEACWVVNRLNLGHLRCGQPVYESAEAWARAASSAAGGLAVVREYLPGGEGRTLAMYSAAEDAEERELANIVREVFPFPKYASLVGLTEGV